MPTGSDAELKQRLLAEIKGLKIQLKVAVERSAKDKKYRRNSAIAAKGMAIDQATVDRIAERQSRKQDSNCDAAGSYKEQSTQQDQKIFDSLGSMANGNLAAATVLDALKQCGLLKDDERLRASFAELLLVGPEGMTFDEFRFIKNESLLLNRALSNKLKIPQFAAFTSEIKDCFDETKANTGGAVAGYIPQLACVEPEQYGVAVCTVDGQRWSHGDSNVPFCIQSSSKPLTYAMALELHGEEKVHQHIGREPSGRNFNSKVLFNSGVEKGNGGHGSTAVAYRHIPHNPCINAGAIMAASLVKPEVNEADRFDYVIAMWKKLAGGKEIGFQNSTYMGERETAARNFCLGYMMTEEEAFPDCNDLIKTLESYFMDCSIEMDAEAMAIVAGTLANGGVCPITGERVFQAETVKKTLTLVQSCGMYDYSGEFAFKVGFPSKSGVSGVLCIVIPGVTGIATFSPRLDELGNSVRGLDFCASLGRRFPFHQFSSLEGCHTGKDVTTNAINSDRYADLWFAAGDGDVQRLKQLVSRGTNVNIADFDRRSALHLAASNGRVHAVRYLLSVGADAAYKDLLGNTPLDDATRENRVHVQAILRNALTAGDKRGANVLQLRADTKVRLKLGQLFLNRLWCTAGIARADSATGKIFHKIDLVDALVGAGIAVTGQQPAVKYLLDELPEFFNNLCFLKVLNLGIRKFRNFTLAKVLLGTLVVPNWSLFKSEIGTLFEGARNADAGKDCNADRFVPELTSRMKEEGETHPSLGSVTGLGEDLGFLWIPYV
jgi:glutaminase